MANLINAIGSFIKSFKKSHSILWGLIPEFNKKITWTFGKDKDKNG